MINSTYQTHDIKVDVAIVGGGIAGLWTANILQQHGLRVALLEKNNLGSTQTICSQGIIHGGLKYALGGFLTSSAKAMASLPTLWQQCLSGHGMLNLTATKVLADAQYLFSPGGLATSISSFFASKALQSSVAALTPADYPLLLQHAKFTGQVYRLTEIVLDVQSLITNLAQNIQGQLIKVDDCWLEFAGAGAETATKSKTEAETEIETATKTWPGSTEISKISNINNISKLSAKIAGATYNVIAQHYILLAGAGNQDLLCQRKVLAQMQLRPLHMVYVKAANLPVLYAHCIGLSTKPRLTITTHYAQDGNMIWYLGGDLAETGVSRTAAEQQAAAKHELEKLFPWVTLSNTKWGCIRIDRAEAGQQHGKKPDNATLFSYGNCHIGWPTKLAFAPLLAQQISDKLTEVGVTANKFTTDLSKFNFAKPEIASYPWDLGASQ